MKIASHLKEEKIKLGLSSKDQNGSITEVAELLKNTGEVSNFDSFLKDIFEREKVSTTGIGKGVAIPHARTDSVKDFVIAFGRSDSGIEYKSLDNSPVNIIFLMGTPKEKGINSYLSILAHLNRLLKKESFRKTLLEAAAPKDIVEAFKKIES